MVIGSQSLGGLFSWMKSLWIYTIERQPPMQPFAYAWSGIAVHRYIPSLRPPNFFHWIRHCDPANRKGLQRGGILLHYRTRRQLGVTREAWATFRSFFSSTRGVKLKIGMEHFHPLASFLPFTIMQNMNSSIILTTGMFENAKNSTSSCIGNGTNIDVTHEPCILKLHCMPACMHACPHLYILGVPGCQIEHSHEAERPSLAGVLPCGRGTHLWQAGHERGRCEGTAWHSCDDHRLPACMWEVIMVVFRRSRFHPHLARVAPAPVIPGAIFRHRAARVASYGPRRDPHAWGQHLPSGSCKATA